MNLSIIEIRLTENLTKNDTLIDSILFECQCALILVDITKPNDLDLVKSLMNNITTNNHPYLKMILIQNKSDCDKKIDDSELTEFLNNNKPLDNLSISIKNGNNIPELINKIDVAINNSNNQLASNLVSETVEKNVKFLNAEGSLSLILVGDSTVGKTCFLNRYFKNQFKSTISNIGIDKDIKFVKINGSIYKLTVWDTVGQERFRSLPRKYYQNADSVLLLFDVTNEESFASVSNWMNDVKENSNRTITSDGNKESDIALYLIGNKIDKPDRVITRDRAEELAKSLGMKYFEVSCKINMNVPEVMANLIMDCHMKVTHTSNVFQLNKPTKGGNERNRKGCC